MTPGFPSSVGIAGNRTLVRFAIRSEYGVDLLAERSGIFKRLVQSAVELCLKLLDAFALFFRQLCHFLSSNPTRV